MDAKEAIKHWAAWGRDLHRGSTCASFEKNYAKDAERFGWSVDHEIAAAFKYKLKVAEKVEETLVKCLNKTELRILVCCEVYGHALTYEVISRRLHMPKNSMETIRLAALNKFRRNWNG